MSRFNPGDRVLVGGTTIAVITTYDEANNLVVYVSNAPGLGSTDTVTAHISLTEITPLKDALAELLSEFEVAPVNHTVLSERPQRADGTVTDPEARFPLGGAE